MSDALREVGAAFGIEWDDAALRRGLTTLDGAVSGVRRIAEIFAGSALLGAVRGFAHEFEAAAGQVEDTAATLGTSATELQELQYAAEQGGLAAEQMTAALATLQRASGGAGAAASSAFGALGVHTRDAAGAVRPLTDLVDDVAAAFDRVEDPARRAVLAQQLFGGAGRRMLTLLHEGEGGLRAWRDEFESLGGGITDDAIAAAGAYGDEANRVTVALTSLRSAVAVVLLPALTWVTQHLTRGVAWFARLARETHVVQVGLAALGAVGGAAAVRMLAAWLPVLAPFLKLALVVLLVDDLITLFQGGDSVIGRFVDRMLGLGVSRNLVSANREAFEGLQLAIRDAGRYLSQAWEGALVAGGDFWRWLVRTAGGIVDLFAPVGRAIDEVFGGAFTRIGARAVEFLRGLAGRIGQFFGGIVDALGLSDLAGNIRRQIGEGIDIWRSILTPDAPAGRATAQPALPAPAGARGGGVTVQQSNQTTIQVTGAGDPAAVAANIERRASEAQARQLRAARAALTREGGG